MATVSGKPRIERVHPALLTRSRVRPRTLSFQQGYSVLATSLAGELDGVEDHGLYVRNTRYLAEYFWQINGTTPTPVVVQPATHNTLMGYYLYEFPEHRQPYPYRDVVDVEIARSVGAGMHEDAGFKNLSPDKPFSALLTLNLHADFADVNEVVAGSRRQQGQMTIEWIEDTQTLLIHYHIEDIHHGLIIELRPTGLRRGTYEDGRITWRLDLPPGQQAQICTDITPIFCGELLRPLYGCYAFHQPQSPRERAEARWLDVAASLQTPNVVVERAYNISKKDLSMMRLWEEDSGPEAWIPAAGVPIYLGVFGRDVLTAGWQSLLMGPEMTQGALAVMDKYQATEQNDWRDEQPGKMVHEVRLGPLSLLDMIPHRRYYGSTTSTPLYIIVLSELYHWTGDKSLLERHLPAMERALDWLHHEGDLDGDGFYEYRTLSDQGLKNQGWKDSNEGIVYADGRQVKNPIATCEEQAWVYEAKIRASMIYAALKNFGLAERYLEEAHQLKAQFNRAFWMPHENYFALALDPEKRQVSSITSNPGHCLATGIVDEDKAGPTIGRMLSPDLFSGWGVRTLSTRHPCYNPYGYHLGTVWPVENGTFCMGFVRYGYYPHAAVIAEALFASSSTFEYGRLPEAISGHPRDVAHPFPAVYPQSNMPQAWSASAVPVALQALLGLYPFAPFRLLFLDPHLPDWLPELALYNVRVGDAKISLKFWRDEAGKTHYRVLEKQGTIRILPHRMNIHAFHRLKDFTEKHLTRL